MAGNRGRGSNGARHRQMPHTRKDPEIHRPCRYFAKGHCHYGQSCKFSHDKQATQVQPRSLDDDADPTLFNEWRLLIKRKPNVHDGNSLARIWKSALDVLDENNRSSQQQLVKDLVDDDVYHGGEYLVLTLEIRLTMNRSFEACAVERFLQSITHTAVLDCLSIGTYTGTVYSIVGGVGGQRAVPFFLDACEYVQNKLIEEASSASVVSLGRLAKLIVTALHELVSREKRVSFNEGIETLLSNLNEIFKNLDRQAVRLGVSHGINQDQLHTLRRIVDIANGLVRKPVDLEHEKAASEGLASQPSAAYKIGLKGPGGRHDNDHLSIEDISIIPTAAELQSDHREYLPSTDFRQPHFLDDPIQRYLDTHFRLLRHDMFGSLKDVLGPMAASFDRRTKNTPAVMDTGLHIFRSAMMQRLFVDTKFGFEMQVSFLLPSQAQKLPLDQRRSWLENSKRLETGVLMCFLAPAEAKCAPLLLLAQKRREEKPDQKNHESQYRTAQIAARLATLREEDLLSAIRSFRLRVNGILVEVPGLIPDTFVPVLSGLQNVQSRGDLPFCRYVVPPVDSTFSMSPQTAEMMSPFYARQRDFEFDLRPIITGQHRTLRIKATASADDESLLDELEENTSLDRGQSQALVSALTREFVLIQGPPGTGKSYLGVKLLQVLLGCKEKAKLGPILIICYTNHALDQFLCHLLDVGIDSIARIGGRSRSERLEPYNLRTLTTTMLKTKHEKYVLGKAYSNLERQMEIAGKKLGTVHQLRKGSMTPAKKQLLQTRHTGIYRQVYQDEGDGFTHIGRDPFDIWIRPRDDVTKLQNGTHHPQGEVDDRGILEIVAVAEQNIHALTMRERKYFSESLDKQLEVDEAERIFVSLEEGQTLRRDIDAAHEEGKRRVLLETSVIGVTTTGFAREAGMLRKLRSKVVVCEEAGEVLEAHVISAMMPGVEHFIQIGDHQQLRPQINNFLELSLESKAGLPFQLDRSQFERLAVGQPGLPKMPVAQLNIQRRMRPEIAELIRPIYKRLEDHAVVRVRPDVVGMKNNIFWLRHWLPEDGSTDSHHVKSHSHTWEVEMTKALARHLVRQGTYSGTDIAVLTPYSGQLMKLRTSLNSEFEVSISDKDEETLVAEGFELAQQDPSTIDLQKRKLGESLRLATVDNFQGEEAKVVIVSLVRSNPEGRVGFLKTVNRINVLLSRAKEGLYLIGNPATYSKIPMWVDVQRQLEESNLIDDAFNLCCPRHPGTVINCSTPEDFLKNSPEGGCSLPCDLRLERCGHQCLAKCHSAAMHAVFQCPQPCPRKRARCNHACQSTCGESCGPCMVPVIGVILPCGHLKDNVPCSLTEEPAKIECEARVIKTVEACGHLVEVPCRLDVNSRLFNCDAPCGASLDCGHKCLGSCSECTTQTATGRKTQHKACRKLCGKPHNTCNHLCSQSCHAGSPCSPCHEKCDVLCAHSKCAQSCAAPCAPCIERCAWSCEHEGRCSMPCAAPCNRLPCNERCSETLQCGHQCPGVCGEACPQDHCQLCGQRAEARVDLLELKTYAEVDLNETPIVVLSCGHFFTAESLDGLVGLSSVYSLDARGEFSGLVDSSEMGTVPRCPDCQRSIRQHATRRYNRVVNHAVMNETSKRFLVQGNAGLQELEKAIEQAAAEPRKDDVPDGSLSIAQILGKRHEGLRKLLRRARRFSESVGAAQQPSHKLFEAILFAKAKESLSSSFSRLGLHQQRAPIPEYRTILGAQLACIQVQQMMIQDEIGLLSSTAGEQTPDPSIVTSVRSFFEECEAMFDESRLQSLPKFTVAASLSYASVAQSMRGMKAVLADLPEGEGCVTKAAKRAQGLLREAKNACQTEFRGAMELMAEVQNMISMLASDWYDEVTKNELQAIRSAMVGGPEGMATHSGHWYQCERGHPFAIGECGMPMEEARCPECGARIGGQDHEMVQGMSRARHMED